LLEGFTASVLLAGILARIADLTLWAAEEHDRLQAAFKYN